MKSCLSLLICWVTSLCSPCPGGGEPHDQALLPCPVKSSLGSKCWAWGGVCPALSCLTTLHGLSPPPALCSPHPCLCTAGSLRSSAWISPQGQLPCPPLSRHPLDLAAQVSPCSALCDDRAARGEGCFLAHRGVTITILLLSMKPGVWTRRRTPEPPCSGKQVLGTSEHFTLRLSLPDIRPASPRGARSLPAEPEAGTWCMWVTEEAGREDRGWPGRCLRMESSFSLAPGDPRAYRASTKG